MSSARAQLIGKSQNVCLSAAVLTSLHTYSCGSASEVWSQNVSAAEMSSVAKVWHDTSIILIKTQAAAQHHLCCVYVRAMQTTWLRGWKCYFEHFVSSTFSPDRKWPCLTDCYDIFEKMMHPNVFGDLMPLICTLRDRCLPLKRNVLLAIT